MIWSGVRLVRSVSVLSCSSVDLVTRMASLVGTLVNNDLTSKLTSISEGCNMVLFMVLIIPAELGTWWGVLPTSGCKILVKCWARLYVGEPRDETIGRSGLSGLWIFGRPKNLGHLILMMFVCYICIFNSILNICKKLSCIIYFLKCIDKSYFHNRINPSIQCSCWFNC